jgi:hypothetical protein
MTEEDGLSICSNRKKAAVDSRQKTVDRAGVGKTRQHNIGTGIVWAPLGPGAWGLGPGNHLLILVIIARVLGSINI